MRSRTRKLALISVAALFAASGALVLTSPAPYKVGLESVLQIWADIARDLDSATRTVTRVSTETEVEIGGEIDAQLWIPHVSDAELQAYVDAVGQRVAAGARRAGIPYRFQVVDDYEANAFAVAGGYIYVTRPMLELVENEAELAAILGHEIAHVDLRHCIELVQTQLFLRRAGLEEIAVLVAIVEDLARVGYSETMEREADRLGMLLAAEAGYSPMAALDIFRRMYVEFEAGEAVAGPTSGPEGEILRSLEGVFDDYFATHPPFLERLDALRSLLDTNASAWEGREFTIGADSHTNRQAGAAGDSFIFDRESFEYLALRAEIANLLDREKESERYMDQLRELYPGDPRIEALQERLVQKTIGAPPAAPVTQAEPPAPRETDTSEKKGEEKPSTVDADEFETAGEAYLRGRQLEKAGDYAEALKAYQRAVELDNMNGDAHAHIGTVAYALGDYALSIAAFEKAVEVQPFNVWPHAQMAWTAERLGEFAMAKEHYEEAIRLDPNYYWALNNYAWMLVSAEPTGVLDLNKAMTLAERATGLKKSAANLDTLAAAYLRLGLEPNALRTYMDAFDIASKHGIQRGIDDLRFLGCLAPDKVEVTKPAVRYAVMVCIAHGTPPFVLSNSLDRIKRVASFNPDRARELLSYLEKDYPDHPAVDALGRESRDW